MGYQRLSIKGFNSELSIRRQVEGFGTNYLCWATLYSGKHFRRKVDEISYSIGTEHGVAAAKELSARAAQELRERHGL